jgi:hypothetical protein
MVGLPCPDVDRQVPYFKEFDEGVSPNQHIFNLLKQSNRHEIDLNDRGFVVEGID